MVLLKQHLLALSAALLTSAMAWMLTDQFAPRSVSSIVLLITLIFSLKTQLGPAIMYSVFGNLAWLIWTELRIEDLTLGSINIFTGLMMSWLNYNLRKRKNELNSQSNDLLFLLEISQVISESKDLESCLSRIFPKVKDHLKGEMAVIQNLKEVGLMPVSLDRGWWLTQGKNLDIARFCFIHKTDAGLLTNIHPEADACYIPMKGSLHLVGTLSFRPFEKNKFKQKDKSLLTSISHQLALFIERHDLLESHLSSIRVEESEKLYHTIFNSLSHEMKTPITAMAGFTSILSGHQKTPLAAEQLYTISKELDINVKRLDRIVTQLLDTSRIESGSLKINTSRFHPAELIEAIEEAFSLDQKIPLQVKLEKDIPEIAADFSLLRQCLENFLLNAFIYAPKSLAITLGAKSHGQSVVEFYVEDEGPGIDSSHSARLFDRFYRVPGTPAGGSGLGLFLVRQVAELHGGHAKYKRNKNKGSTFSIFIPINNHGRHKA